jgi:ATP-dependent DNA helicase DinG
MASASISVEEPQQETKQQFPSVTEFFTVNGVLAKATGLRFEHRPGQLLMALHVEKGLVEQSHLVVEAGTGTGKTLAYLFPALRYATVSKQRIVISTGTKSLQEQLFFKDVPFLESLFGPQKISYLKGRSNYLCHQKLITIQPASVHEEVDLQLIRPWAKTTETGDRAELPALSDYSTVWNKIDARTDACTGKVCPGYNECTVTLARQHAAESSIIIVNHHLFLSDLAIRMKNPDAGILPSYDAVVFDEAHELEQVASDCFGLSVSNRRFGSLLADVSVAARGLHYEDRIQKAAAELTKRADLFWDVLPGMDQPERLVFDKRAHFMSCHRSIYDGVVNACRLLYSALRLHEADEKIAPLILRSDILFQEFRFMFEDEGANVVFWIERVSAGHGKALNTHVQATPIDVAPYLKDHVFAEVGTAVLTSATLAVQDRFEHIRRSLGIEDAEELIVPSQFNYKQQAILFVPKDMPRPNDPAFFNRASSYISQLLTISEGRAFCLFTSYDVMNKMYAALKPILPYPLLLHGSTPRSELLSTFRHTKNAVLFGTSSFWQGIDVQGEQLSCVIIDKLPFVVPTDPIHKARTEAIEAKGGSGFRDYQVPKAALALKQGFGRLIRSSTDHGILAILDPRILSPSYGKMFIESLPDYQLSNDIEDIRKFMNSRSLPES